MPSTASSITSYLTFFLLLSLVSAQLKTCPIKSPTLLFSKCLNYEALKAYTGTWFQIAVTRSFNQRVQAGQGCVSVKYSFTASGDIARKNCYFNKSTQELVCAEGVGVQESARPGRFDVTFTNNPLPSKNSYTILQALGGAQDGFKALAIYTCGQTDSAANQSFFILSRKNTLSNVDFTFLEGEIKRKGIKLEEDNQLEMTDQTDCTYQD